MNISYKSKVRISIIVLIILSIDFFNTASSSQKMLERDYTTKIKLLENEVENYKLKIADMKEEYGNELKTIVKSLYKDEIFGIGGDMERVDPSIDKLYRAIINYTNNDFSKILSNTNNFFDKRNKLRDNYPDILPVRYNNSVRITSGYGLRYSPISGKLIFHTGIDITAHDFPTPIIATANGVVTDVWIYHKVYGKMVIIKHDYGLSTLYAHMKRTIVREGQTVRKGQVIGYMGATGEAHGRHVHYEIRKNGKLQNPLDYLRQK